MSQRFSVRRKATRGVVWKMLLHRGEDERILKCFSMILDMERREGLYVITSGTRLGWLMVVWLDLSVSLRVIAWTRWISFLRKESFFPGNKVTFTFGPSREGAYSYSVWETIALILSVTLHQYTGLATSRPRVSFRVEYGHAPRLLALEPTALIGTRALVAWLIDDAWRKGGDRYAFD